MLILASNVPVCNCDLMQKQESGYVILKIYQFSCRGGYHPPAQCHFTVSPKLKANSYNGSARAVTNRPYKRFDSCVPMNQIANYGKIKIKKTEIWERWTKSVDYDIL